MTLRAEGVSRIYFRNTGEANHFAAVQRTDLTLEAGKVTVLMGRSGSGKTTLLHMLAGLLSPTEGKVFLEGTDLYALEDRALSRLRNERIGVIPQGRSAVETLSVMENLLLPQMLYGSVTPAQRAEAAGWLERMGIGALADSSPRELSGGELRRMALARALWRRPAVILADEPTGDLDDENTRLALAALREAAGAGAAVLLVTHENEAEKYADVSYRMDAGRLTRAE